MVLNQARIEHVRRMRTAAQLCMVALFRDVAGRQLVAEMMARTRSSSGPASAKADAEKAYKLYEATFEGRDTALPVLAGVEADGSAQAETQSDKQFRLRGRSFLFTYNWGFFRRPLPDGTLAPTSSSELWRYWRKWKNAKKEELSVRRSTSGKSQHARGTIGC